MAEVGDENIEKYIDVSYAISIEYLLDIKDLELEQKIRLLVALEDKCSPKNYIAYFELNYKLAKLRYKYSEAADTSE